MANTQNKDVPKQERPCLLAHLQSKCRFIITGMLGKFGPHFHAAMFWKIRTNQNAWHYWHSRLFAGVVL